jgi:hypothetical protein
MKKIIVIHFDRLTNEAHYQFVFVFRTMVDACQATKALLAAFIVLLDQLLKEERKAIDAPHGSLVTPQIQKADKALDKQLDLMFAAIDTARYSSNPAMVQAAEDLLFALKPYGHIQGKKYEAEMGAVKSLLETLRDNYLTQSVTVGIAQWFDLLQEEAEIEESLFAQRNAENAQRAQQKKVKEIRKEIDDLYHRMVEGIEVAAATDTTGAYDTFIAELNEKIHYENEHHQPHKKDIENAIIDNVPDQQLDETGYATPNCNVSIKDHATDNMLKLVFAKDYAITYKHNNKIGNAELIVHGKGGYRGQKLITFKIVV